MFRDDGESQSGFFQVKIESTGAEAIRRWRPYPPFDDDGLFVTVHKAGNVTSGSGLGGSEEDQKRGKNR